MASKAFLQATKSSNATIALLPRHFSTTGAVSMAGKDGGKDKNKDLLLVKTVNGVTTMTMNNPKKLNGWTEDMLLTLQVQL